MLAFRQVSGGYGQGDVLKALSFSVQSQQSVALLGANGAGKTTTLRALSGLLPEMRGEVIFQDQPLHELAPHTRVHSGIAHVPEGRHVFPALSVYDNLSLGAISLPEKDEQVEARIFRLFPRLKERCFQMAGTLSGGEQQMLAIGRALMAKPKLLVLDEPSMGLAPKLVGEVFDVLSQLQTEGMSLLIVEQYAKRALSLCHYAYVLSRGAIVLEGHPDEVSDGLERAYLE